MSTRRCELATIMEDLGTDSLDGLVRSAPEALDGLRAVDPRLTNRGTARELTRLLTLIWSDAAAPPDCCQQVRRILGLQVWPHRLSSGFPEDAIKVSGKTGTLLRWRNEVGVVEYPDHGRYALAVFTKSRRLTEKNPAADAVIGQAARLAVDRLRRPM